MYVEEDICKRREEVANNIAKSFDDDFCKAHNHGDLHPNGKWYWESSANGGKGDWRTIKKTAAPSVSITPKDVYNDIQGLNPRIQTISSMGNFVSNQSQQLAIFENQRIAKYLPKNSLAYKILISHDKYTDKQLWVIAYELMKNDSYKKDLSLHLIELQKNEENKKRAVKYRANQTKNVKKEQETILKQNGTFKVDDGVEHPILGKGKVVKTNQDAITVVFEKEGEKVLLKKYAKLKAIS